MTTKDKIPTYSFTIDPARTALVIVDMQYAAASRTRGYVKSLSDAGRSQETAPYFDRIETVVVPNLQGLLSFFREHSLKVIYIASGCLSEDFSDAPPHRSIRYRFRNQRKGSPEYEFLDEIKPLPTDYVVHKTTINTFVSTGLDSALRSFGVECLLFSGVLTEVCVGGTARHAADLGYRSLLLEDCCASTDDAFHLMELVTFRSLFGRVDSTKSVIDEMTRRLQGGCPAPS